MGWLSGWNYRQKITIDHTLIDADLTNFPVKVIVPSDNLLFSKAKSDGSDVRFAASDGTTLLDFEREVHATKGLLFDGTNDTCDVGSSTDFDFQGGLYTIESRFAAFGDGKIVICELSGSNYPSFTIEVAGGKLRCYTRALNQPASQTPGDYFVYADFELGKTYLFRQIYDGTNTKIYLNGSLVYSTTEWGVPYYNSSNHVTVGCSYTNTGGYTNFGNIQIDILKFWNGVANTTYDVDEPLTGNETGLVAYYKFDEGSGTVLTDYAGNNDGTVTGATWVNNTAVYHLKVPFISSTTDTGIYMYYGNPSATDASNPSAVWDSDYELVMHMGPTLEDSTSNGNDGVNYGTTLGLSGDGYYRDFDGINDYILIADNDSLDLNATFTLEAFTQVDTVDMSKTFIAKNKDDGYSAYCMDTVSTGNLRCFGYEGTTAHGITSGTFIPQTATKYLLHGRKNNSIWTVGHDGVIADTKNDSATLNSTTNTLSIGGRYFNNSWSRLHDGKIYEVRISSTARSDAWIKATSATLRDQLLTFGAEEESPIIVTTNMMLAFNF